MILNNINDANEFVLKELATRKLQECKAGWVNNHLNVVYYCTLQNGTKKTYYLKFDRNPFYKGGEEAGFKGAAVTFNATIFNHYVEIPKSDILYALPLRVYHIMHDDLMKVITEPYPQAYNKEIVVAAPFFNFSKWATNIPQD